MTTAKESRRLRELERCVPETTPSKKIRRKPEPITKIKTRKTKSTIQKVLIDLSGPEGNAFYLLALAKKWSTQLELNYLSIYNEMTSGDYDHLCDTFLEHFGMFAQLYNSSNEESC